jgi:hypothetical protein
VIGYSSLGHGYTSVLLFKHWRPFFSTYINKIGDKKAADIFRQRLFNFVKTSSYKDDFLKFGTDFEF